jgi:CDP-diacylglycerol--serine O-phosphatidyltransferase
MKENNLISKLSRPDYVTLLAVFFIVNAFWLLCMGKVYLAIAVAFLSTFLDYLDGVIARRYGGSPYGKIYDSLYDVLGWVLFPALVINHHFQWQWWVVIITTLFCVSGVMRLGRFTVEGYTKQDKFYYVGVPVLYSKYAVLTVFSLNGLLSVAILAIMVPLMISSRLIPKQNPFLAQLELVYALIFLYLNFTHV